MTSFWWHHQITSPKIVIKITLQKFSVFKPSSLAKSWLRPWPQCLFYLFRIRQILTAVKTKCPQSKWRFYSFHDLASTSGIVALLDKNRYDNITSANIDKLGLGCCFSLRKI